MPQAHCAGEARTCDQAGRDVAAGGLKVLAAVLVAAKGYIEVGQAGADQGKKAAKADEDAISNSLRQVGSDNLQC